MSFKHVLMHHLPGDFCLLIIRRQVIKVLLSDSLKCFKTMKFEQHQATQYPGQKVTDTSLDVTHCCQALTTAGIWDHQLHSSILFAFLLTNGNELYCHSLITLKVTREDELKKARFMEHAAGITHLHSKGLSYADIVTLPELGTKKPKVWVSGLLPHIPRTPRHHLLPSPMPKSMPLSNASRRANPLLSCETREMTLATSVVRKNIGLTKMSKQGLLCNKSLL